MTFISLILLCTNSCITYLLELIRSSDLGHAVFLNNELTTYSSSIMLKKSAFF